MAEEKPEKNQPEQHQDRMPAMESEMAPEPVYEDENWVPRGDLEGKVALVTGGDSGIGTGRVCAVREGGCRCRIRLPRRTWRRRDDGQASPRAGP